MKLILLMVFMLLALLASCANESIENSPEGQSAIKAATEWLELTDVLNGEESWGKAAKLFKQNLSASQWKMGLEAMRAPLGNLLTRKVNSIKRKDKILDKRNGNFLIIEFEASFRNHSRVQETVMLVKEDDQQWRVAAYYLNKS